MWDLRQNIFSKSVKKRHFLGVFKPLPRPKWLLSNPDPPKKFAPGEGHKTPTSCFFGSLNDFGVYAPPGLEKGMTNFYLWYLTFWHKTVKYRSLPPKNFFRQLYRIPLVINCTGPQRLPNPIFGYSGGSIPPSRGYSESRKIDQND